MKWCFLHQTRWNMGAAGKWAKEDYLQKYLPVLIFIFDLLRLNVKTLIACY